MGSPMPRDLSEEAVAKWLYCARFEDWGALSDGYPAREFTEAARAVLALVREKVREAAGLACRSPYSNTRSIVNHVVSRVMGDHPQGGHDEARKGRGEAPRG